jgi:2-methylcitrate dehydratase PrpD
MDGSTLTEQLVEKILDVRYDSLPEEAVEISKQVVLDGLAVTHAGATEPLGVGRISTAYVREMGGNRRQR